MNETITQLVTYPISELVIKELQIKADSLNITSIEDKINYNLVDTARKEAKALKSNVENRRKELKADSLAFGRLVDSEAAKYYKPLEEIEESLEAKQKKIDDEKTRIKLDIEQEAKMPNRKLLLAEFENIPADLEIKYLSDLDFQGLIQKLVGERQAKIQAEQEKEKQRLEQERIAQESKLEAERLLIQAEQEKLLAAERKLEADKVAAERVRLENEKKAFQAEQDRIHQIEIKAEQDRIQLLEIQKTQKITDWKTENKYDEKTDIIQKTINGFAIYRFVSEIHNI